MFYVRYKIGNSPGKGKGVFAAQSIKKGQRIFTLDGPYITWDEAIRLGRQNHAMPVSPELYANMELENTLNHSCNPNIGYADATTGIAMRDIADGEELLWDYSMLTADGWTMDCRCDHPNCRQLIGNFAGLPPALQELYRPFTPQWVLRNLPE